jgi:glutathione peroxidase
MSGKRLSVMFTGMVLALTAVSGLVAEQAQKEPADHKGGTATMDSTNYLDIPFHTITGQPASLTSYKGKVVLIVNVASECGFTPQYEGLEALYRQYKDNDLVVIGFPANNFGGQEPGTNEQILNFCRTKYDVTFPMMSKISVKGKDKHPLFVYLTEKSTIHGEIKWNFSKFLLDRNGNLVARYPSEVTPQDKAITTKIDSLLYGK